MFPLVVPPGIWASSVCVTASCSCFSIGAIATEDAEGGAVTVDDAAPTLESVPLVFNVAFPPMIVPVFDRLTLCV